MRRAERDKFGSRPRMSRLIRSLCFVICLMDVCRCEGLFGVTGLDRCELVRSKVWSQGDSTGNNRRATGCLEFLSTV